jgi:mRNA interferase RelE/StbE
MSVFWNVFVRHEQVESAPDFGKIIHLKKLTGPRNFYRIRIGDYRIGLVLEKEVVEFVRFLPRKDLYRLFP